VDEGLHGLRIPAPLGIDDAQVVPGRRELGIEPDGEPVQLLRLGMSPILLEQQGERKARRARASGSSSGTSLIAARSSQT